MNTVNGVPADGQWHWNKKLRPSQGDKGHSIVRFGQRASWSSLSVRRAIECQCGKVYRGWGSRAIYSYEAHLRKETGR
jgi:hypothetical protein